MESERGRSELSVKAQPNCYLCGTDGRLLVKGLRDHLFGAPGAWSFLQCPRCGLVWLHPRPAGDGIAAMYDDYYTHEPETARGGRLARVRSQIEAQILASESGYVRLLPDGRPSLLGAVLSHVGPLRDAVKASTMWVHSSDGGKLLDVGCGSGRFLARMRDLGWEVSGVEPDPAAATTARRVGLDVLTGTIEEAGLPADTYDVITLAHVIEHVPNPIATLRECRRILKPAGRLVVVTPNTESLGKRLFKRSWAGWHPPYHLILFTPSLLKVCAERAELRVIEARDTARSAHFMWYESRILSRGGALLWDRVAAQFGRPHAGGLLFWGVEYTLAKFAPYGEEIVLTATKDVG